VGKYIVESYACVIAIKDVIKKKRSRLGDVWNGGKAKEKWRN
jgi:hypothetical protein